MKKLITPIPPPYNPMEWVRSPLPQRARQVCEAWALQGFGAPLSVYLFYLLKVAFYILGWVFFCSFSPSLGGMSTIEQWWLSPLAFQKAVIWSVLFEGIGIGCGSGPLTARYLPPFGGALYFLRLKTTKLPVFSGAPLIGKDTRGLLDISLYGALLMALLWALCAPEISQTHLILICVLPAILGVLDQTIFLIIRAEHYWVTLLCFLWAGDQVEIWIMGAMAVQLSLWFWAGFSKLNAHFPSVVGVMLSNHPLNRSLRLRRAIYRNFPDDLRPSRLTTWAAHMGTALELATPLVFLYALYVVGHSVEGELVGGGFFGSGAHLELLVAMGLMLSLHIFITSNIPLGVPIEWNFMVVYGAFVLFWAHPTLTPLDLFSSAYFGQHWPLIILLTISLFLIPLIGNFSPKHISFLLSMRYYAGNWPYSVWLFKGDSHHKLKQLTTTSPWIEDQLRVFYDESTTTGLIGRVMGFRMMHLQGRMLSTLLPLTIEGDFTEYKYLEGEVIAGIALGWNFGDGHLHQEQLLSNIQRQCGFSSGELRCLFVESQPFGKKEISYQIYDACDGALDRGEVNVDELQKIQPWDQLP